MRATDENTGAPLWARDLRPPRISVCIVVFNGRALISRALDSVLDQKCEHAELLVVDGGSTDGTLEVLDRYAGRIAKSVSAPDSGIYDAMNKACALAQGDWLIFLGCDDVLLDCLATVAEKLRDPAAVYYGNVIWRSTGRVYGGKFSKYRLMQSNICHQSIFYPRQVYASTVYNLKYRYLADYEYNIKLIGRGVRFEFIDVDIALYNDAGASMSGDPAFETDRLGLIRDNFGRPWEALKRLRNLAVCAIKGPA